MHTCKTPAESWKFLHTKNITISATMFIRKVLCRACDKVPEWMTSTRIYIDMQKLPSWFNRIWAFMLCQNSKELSKSLFRYIPKYDSKFRTINSRYNILYIWINLQNAVAFCVSIFIDYLGESQLEIQIHLEQS